MGGRQGFEWDDAKATDNLRRGRPAFEEVLQFNFTTAIFGEDNRIDYGEVRIKAIGFVRERLHVLVYTERDGRIRVISFRKANDREIKRYDRQTRSFHQN
ncbi:BrnT family toxin [Jiella sp. MQZ9-1]|uniref:BrnT family toxin n=1 Tax=Jiella flava TaxID=2816857 RepID=A0A939JUF9_9HYPH|nr:BrnT family toxin [Jiella flava]MBO0663140.1 BrnT family toxin [Jiella flava]MCD2471559.1 BrnT family toxin [Jiella flava]